MADRSIFVLFFCAGVAVVGYAGCGGGGNTTSTGGTGDDSTSASSGTTSATSTGATSSSHSSNSAVVGVTSGGDMMTLAVACAADADCAMGLTCLKDSDTNSVLGGGPAGGYCSKVCKTDSDCPGQASVCIKSDQAKPGICALGCDQGPQLMSLQDPLDPAKCYGRDDLRCEALSMTSSVCLPTCGKDEQCPAGRVCDPRLAVCVDKPSTGKPDGAKCDPKAAMPECEGVCLSVTGGAAMCSNHCVLGGDVVGGPNCGGIEKGVCIYSIAGSGAGDSGFCSPPCLKHDDCQNPSFWCIDLGAPQGYCVDAETCANGQSDCKNPKTATCTQTKYGPVCINPKYPLGSASPDDGGAGDSGDSGPDDGGDSGPSDAASD